MKTYLISIGKKTYRCSGYYEEITLKIPCCAKEITKIFNKKSILWLNLAETKRLENMKKPYDIMERKILKIYPKKIDHPVYVFDKYDEIYFNNVLKVVKQCTRFDSFVKKNYDAYQKSCIDFVCKIEENEPWLFKRFGCEWEKNKQEKKGEKRQNSSEIDSFDKNSYDGENVDAGILLIGTAIVALATVTILAIAAGKSFSYSERKESIIQVVADKIETVRKFEKQDKEYRELEQKLQNYANEIKEDFDNRKVLKYSSLPLVDKFQAFKYIKEICLDYIPKLKDETFNLHKYCKNYPEFFDQNVCSRFEEDWKRINRSIYFLSQGINGERKVEKILEYIDLGQVFLKNYQGDSEHDFIIITHGGVYTVEVKNLYGDCTISESGILIQKTNYGEKERKNIAEQSLRHAESLHRSLKGCPVFNNNIQIKEIICIANDRFKIENHFEGIEVCYPTTLKRTILQLEGGINVLNSNEIEQIKDYLLEHEQEKRKFDLFLPKGEISGKNFAYNFAFIASRIRNIKEIKSVIRYTDDDFDTDTDFNIEDDIDIDDTSDEEDIANLRANF